MDNQNHSNKNRSLLTILGVFVCFVIVVFASFKISNILTNSKIASSVVKGDSLTQLPSIPGESIKWVKTFKVSEVNDKQHLLEIPKVASNIKFSVIEQSIKKSTPAKKITKVAPVKKNIIIAEKRKLSELSRVISKSEASLAIAESIKKQKEKGFIVLIQRIFAGVGSMFATVGDSITGTSTDDVAFVELSATSSTSTEQIIITAELPEEVFPEEIISSSTEATTTEKVVAEEIIVNPESTTTDGAIATATSTEEIPIVETLAASSSDSISVEYETPAPVIAEANTDTGKIVTVSAEDTLEAPVKNVLAFTNIPEIYKVGQENKIKIKWTNNDSQEMQFTTSDEDANGYIDHVEWIVPHLSTQTFEIIFISRALRLDADKNTIEDIYDLVKSQDQNYANLLDGQYVRVTFESILDRYSW